MWCDVWGQKRGGCPSYMLRTLKWIPWMDEEVDEFLIEGKLILEISLFPFSVLKQQRGVEIFIVCFYHCICTYDWLVIRWGSIGMIRETWGLISGRVANVQCMCFRSPDSARSREESIVMYFYCKIKPSFSPPYRIIQLFCRAFRISYLNNEIIKIIFPFQSNQLNVRVV